MAKSANEMILSTGQTVTWSPPKGKHAKEAGRLTSDEPDNSMLFSMAVVSQVALIDGAPITLGEMDEIPFSDVLKLIGAIMGKGN